MSRPIVVALYAPADRPERFEKALRAGADAVIVDLEDAITASPQADARAALASGPAVDIWRKLWAPAIDDYLYRADKQRLSRSAQQLVTGASQLALNRLGFSFREQAALGLYARAWSMDIEAQYSGEERSRPR
nr:aldolase/citrate lyase family protein [Arthrobacter sp. zg-Y820]